MIVWLVVLLICSLAHTPFSPRSHPPILPISSHRPMYTGFVYRLCFLKGDLIRRLEESASKGASASKEIAPAGMDEIERRRIDTFSRVSPCVAYIQTTRTAPAPFQLRPMEVPSGAGSGFLWDDQVRCRVRVRVRIRVRVKTRTKKSQTCIR